MSHAGIFGSAAFLWPAMITAEAGRTASALAQGLIDLALPGDFPESAHGGRWATKNQVLRELPTMRLRDFSIGTTGAATLVCAPFALHAANIADFAHGHSLIETLRLNGSRSPVPDRLAVRQRRRCDSSRSTAISPI